jgi:hypothetical protein
MSFMKDNIYSILVDLVIDSTISNNKRNSLIVSSSDCHGEFGYTDNGDKYNDVLKPSISYIT